MEEIIRATARVIPNVEKRWETAAETYRPPNTFFAIHFKTVYAVISDCKVITDETTGEPDLVYTSVIKIISKAGIVYTIPRSQVSEGEIKVGKTRYSYYVIKNKEYIQTIMCRNFLDRIDEWVNNNILPLF
jgi:effector-binding domain-containing protein